ncbi:MAG: hypothetical protein ABI633_12205, partial [Burkholderiales bacterium]
MQGVDITTIVGSVVTVAAFALALTVAIKKGTFTRSKLDVLFYALPGSVPSSSELVVGGPHQEAQILIPVLLKLENKGSATSRDLEISVESDSCTVVNHPPFFISPVATDSTESVCGDTIYPGSGVFRRTFKVSELHPGKSVQLNNSGLPRNGLSGNLGIVYSSIKVNVFQPGYRRREFEFGVWHVDTSSREFREGLRLISNRLGAEYQAKPLLQRALIRLRHRRFERRVYLIEVVTLRAVSI